MYRPMPKQANPNPVYNVFLYFFLDSPIFRSAYDDGASVYYGSYHLFLIGLFVLFIDGAQIYEIIYSWQKLLLEILYVGIWLRMVTTMTGV